MSNNLEVESTLTDRYQTTVPETVRRALRLGKRDKIQYSIRESGEVVLSRSGGTEDEDPALGAFLSFLAKDMAQQPERLQAVDEAWVQHLQALVGQVNVDFDAALPLDDE